MDFQAGNFAMFCGEFEFTKKEKSIFEFHQSPYVQR